MIGNNLASEGCHNATGATAGLQGGYRWQAYNWVYGIEVQGNWTNFTGSNVSTLIPTQRDRSRVIAFGLFTGQIGYAFSDMLFYVKGGGAVLDNKYDIFSSASGAMLAKTDQQGSWGGAVGAGLEYGIAPDVSIGIEYNHVFLADRNLQLTSLPGVINVPGSASQGGYGFQTDRITQGVDMGLVRLNYRFGGPSLAKY